MQMHNFKIKISPRKNNIFHPGFFSGKIWFSTFDCARFLNKIFQMTGKGKISVYRSLYFQKSGDFLKYKDLYLSIHRFLAFPHHLEDFIQKTCAIERREPYLARKKNLDEKYYFFAEKS